jgi:hypothetical protein
MARVQTARELTLDIFAEAEQARGVDLGVEQDQVQGAQLLCTMAFELSAAFDLEVYDPQLGRLVSVGDTPLILSQFEQGQAFAQGALLSYAPLPAVRITPMARLWLIVIVGIFLLLLVVRNL